MLNKITDKEEGKGCGRLRLGFEMVDPVSGYSLVLDAAVGFLVSAYGAELELRDEEGAVLILRHVPCHVVAGHLRAYLEGLRRGVRVLAEDAWVRPPVRQLKVECEPCHESGGDNGAEGEARGEYSLGHQGWEAPSDL